MTTHRPQQDGDLIDRIGELVDNQMAVGEPCIGFDFGDPHYPKCGHCGRAWHGLKITMQIESMRATGVYDESYSYTADDSPVLCEGSEFIGPMKYAPRPQHQNPFVAGGEAAVAAMLDAWARLMEEQ
jgi:hypothetical protein